MHLLQIDTECCASFWLKTANASAACDTPVGEESSSLQAHKCTAANTRRTPPTYDSFLLFVSPSSIDHVTTPIVVVVSQVCILLLVYWCSMRTFQLFAMSYSLYNQFHAFHDSISLYFDSLYSYKFIMPRSSVGGEPKQNWQHIRQQHIIVYILICLSHCGRMRTTSLRLLNH